MPADAKADHLPVEVFFSYAHKDEKMRLKLEAHLSALRRDNLISGWHDRKILPGAEWKNAIDEHVETADVILLLISAEFLNSDYCYDIELKRAVARHDAGEALVVPIILRPCDWLKSPFGKLQALPRDGKPVSDWATQDHAFNEVARGIRRIIEEARKVVARKRSASQILSGKTKKGPKRRLPKRTAGIHVPPTIERKLEQMRRLQALFRSEGDLVEEKLLKEYRTMLAEMVRIFLPLVSMLAKSGLLTVNLNIEDIRDIKKFSTLFGDPTFVFDNGNIWIDAEESGGVLRKSAKSHSKT